MLSIALAMVKNKRPTIAAILMAVYHWNLRQQEWILSAFAYGYISSQLSDKIVCLWLMTMDVMSLHIAS